MFEWNVRFDHFALAEELRTQGIPCLRTLTHVLQTDGDYEETFARFDSTARNLVRRARREGLAVRTSNRAEDVSAYYDIHVKLASTKGNYKFLYPPEFFDELLKLDRDVAFIVAEHENKMIGGAWFFRDGDTLLYWHSAMDLAYSKHSPTYAILDYAIRMAHNERRCFFNFGSSCGMSSLERFKIKWGAEPRYCWHFHWQNPLWETVQKFRSHLNSYAG
jgi:lipid II:glycine glycyltransferase (peptidoglycan interpeptide bridge formation enzyme)